MTRDEAKNAIARYLQHWEHWDTMNILVRKMCEQITLEIDNQIAYDLINMNKRDESK